MSDDAPRIYVASLADYNAGRLHGRWIHATDTMDEIWAQIHRMLEGSHTPEAEEFAIHDHEGFWPAEVREYEPLEYVHRLALGIEKHGRAFAHWVVAAEPDDDLDEQLFLDQYTGRWDSMRDYASDLLDEILENFEANIPEVLRPYIKCDIELFAQDLLVITSMTQDETGVYVFDTK